MKALIDDKGVVAQVEQEEFEMAPPCFWVECPDNIIAGQYTYNNGVFDLITYPSPTATENKLFAMQLLKDTDWTVLPDVGLENKEDWISFRAAIRAIALNPAEGDMTWPRMPPNTWL